MPCGKAWKWEVKVNLWYNITELMQVCLDSSTSRNPGKTCQAQLMANLGYSVVRKMMQGQGPHPVGVKGVQGEVEVVGGILSLAEQGADAATLEQSVPAVASQAPPRTAAAPAACSGTERGPAAPDLHQSNMVTSLQTHTGVEGPNWRSS